MTRPAQCWRHIGVSGDSSCPELRAVVHCRNCPVFTEAGRALMERPAPDGYVDEWTRLLADSKIRGAARILAVLVFRLGDEWLALDAKTVSEVAEVRPAHRIAHRTGGALEGLVNIRGQLLLQVSLHGILQVRAAAPSPDAKRAHARLVVIQHGDESWVFRADEVHGVQRFAPAELGPVPVTMGHRMAKVSTGILPMGERLVGCLEGDAVFALLREAVG